jgi:predicted RNase H-like nuclease (RuvC/YqgF family)
MVQKVFNYSGSDSEYELFRNSVGNVSQYITAIIKARLPQKENAIVSLYQNRLEANLSQIEEHKLQIKFLEQENANLLEQIKDAKEEHEEVRAKTAKEWARNRQLEIKGSVDLEYSYIKRMKEESFQGTMEDYLIQEWYNAN